jgi:hypothetical protein
MVQSEGINISLQAFRFICYVLPKVLQIELYLFIFYTSPPYLRKVALLSCINFQIGMGTWIVAFAGVDHPKLPAKEGHSHGGV